MTQTPALKPGDKVVVFATLNGGGHWIDFTDKPGMVGFPLEREGVHVEPDPTPILEELVRYVNGRCACLHITGLGVGHEPGCGIPEHVAAAASWLHPSIRWRHVQDWRHAGLPCFLTKHEYLDHYTGHVTVPYGHPAAGRHCDDPKIEPMGPNQSHVTEEGGMQFGIGCLHSDQPWSYPPGGSKDTLEEVIALTNQLAEKLAEMKWGPL